MTMKDHHLLHRNISKKIWETGFKFHRWMLILVKPEEILKIRAILIIFLH